MKISLGNSEKGNKLRIILRGILLLFLLMNFIAYMHAWNFTHFESGVRKTPPPEELSVFNKISVLFTGYSLPRPENFTVPEVSYESTILTLDEDSIALWEIDSRRNLGTVAMFHGYLADRTTLLEQAERLRRLGYRTVLVDFRGSGGSSGSSTSIGYHEMQEVRVVYDYLKEKYGGPLILFGTSMGAAAILRSVSKQNLNPDGIILECPFGTLYEAITNRFQSMHVPTFPMAGMLVFWGGIQNGYWGFDHNPADYARDVTCPVLLMYGNLDVRVTKDETQAIYHNLSGEKQLITFPNAGHGKFLEEYENEWMASVHSFLKAVPRPKISVSDSATDRTNLSGQIQSLSESFLHQPPLTR